MTLIPNPVLLRELARERQARYQASAPRRGRRDEVLPVRIRLGRAVMAAGASISGDCLDLPARPTAARQAASA